MKCIDLVIPSKNPGDEFLCVIRAWLAQELPDGWMLNIFVVDDGSRERVRFNDMHVKERVFLLRNTVSGGRSVARNQGASVGSGDIIVFADADCIPLSRSVVRAYVEALRNVDLGVGCLTSSGDGFWAKYFCEIASRREGELAENNKMAFTSANFAIARTLYEQIKGFDERYTAYGFEDKDFIARLDKLSVALSVVSGAILSHSGDNDLEVISQKIYEAGRSSSKIFMGNHPLIYCKLKYYKADARVSVTPYIMVALLGWASRPLIKVCGIIVNSESRFVPYRLKCWIVKFCMLLSFAKGTSFSARESK